ncbi:MAG: Gfo/Idh/MocA family oxidoreductase [Ardenticatenaceae bacterium]|nr:Gfo/Idh/MocA family oxidoreductase [Ardenticatenaceae bacterium]
MKIGMISFAHMHAAGYAQCLQKIGDVTLAGIYDDNAERGQKMAQTFGVPFFAEAQALLDEKLDGVIICSENVKHRPFVELCAGQTNYILCEKPIATTVADAQAMIDVCAQRGTKLQIAYPVRFTPAMQKLKQTLDEGKLGRLYSAKCTNHGSMPGGWFVEEAMSGGGAVIDHTVHVIDLLRWFWDTEVVEVYAEVGDSLLHPELGIDDAGMLSFKLANGIYGTLDTSWSRPPSSMIWGDVKIEIMGEKGAVLVDAYSQNVTVSSNKVGQTKLHGWGSNADLGLIQDFVGAIREGREPSITGYDGLKSMEVALMAYESAREKRPITF